VVSHRPQDRGKGIIRSIPRSRRVVTSSSAQQGRGAPNTVNPISPKVEKPDISGLVSKKNLTHALYIVLKGKKRT